MPGRPESITSRAWINFFKINNASIELEICAFFDLFIMDVGAIDGTCEQQYTFLISKRNIYGRVNDFFFYIKKLLKKGAITRREVIDAHSAPGIFGPITFQYIFVYIFLNKCYSNVRYFTLDKDFVLIITILRSK